MSERSDAIAADVADAKARLLCGDPRPGLRLCSLELDEDTVSFQVDGYQGEFTAFLGEPYPSGETSVYGPDDLELQFTGPVAEVLQSVLDNLGRRLERRGGRSGEPELELELELEAADEGEGEEGRRPASSPLDEGLRGVETADLNLEETPMEPRLARDVQSAREILGDHAVAAVPCGLETWRVRLQVDVTDALGVPMVDPMAAGAWGLDPCLPITVELHLPTKGYMEPGMLQRKVVNSVWQGNFPKFALGKQLVQILSDFTAVALGAALDVPNSRGHSEEELENVHKYFARKVELISDAQIAGVGFLVHVVRYAQLRIATVHEYCSICDQPFVLGPMFLRTVCSQELCIYQLEEFGKKLTTAEGVNTQAEIVDLLVCMLMRAAASPRRETILDPFPCVHGADGRSLTLDPKAKDFERVQKSVDALAALRKECAHRMGAAWLSLSSRMTQDEAALVRWVVSSNRSYLAPLQDEDRIASFRTPFQYLLISAPPDRERAFQELKTKYGSSFAYHGSPTENWHSILRNGLKNTSNTKMMINGAAHGPGVYLATDSQTSVSYAMNGSVGRSRGTAGLWSSGGQGNEAKRQKTGNRFLEQAENLVMLAVCEVINDPSIHKHGSIWVAPREETVCTRFFLVFTGASSEVEVNHNVPIAKLAPDIRACMEKMRVGLPAVHK